MSETEPELVDDTTPTDVSETAIEISEISAAGDDSFFVDPMVAKNIYGGAALFMAAWPFILWVLKDINPWFLERT